MFARNSMIVAVAAVSFGLAGAASAQTSSDPALISGSDRTQRTGSNVSLGTVQRDHAGNGHRQPHVWKGSRANNQILNVGNPLPERTLFGNVGDIDNSKTGTLNRLPGGDAWVERDAVIASDRVIVTPAPVPEQRNTVIQSEPMSDSTLDSGSQMRADSSYDSRFLKPADPAVVTPDVKDNAGVDRTLRQDINLGRTDRAIAGNTVMNDELALRDISNNPIDSQNDPRFRNPEMPESSFDSARTAGETIQPDSYVPPATQPSTYVPAAPMTYENRAIYRDNNYRDLNTRSTHEHRRDPVWKGERALDHKLNVGNPLPERTVFGQTGDVPAQEPVNRLPR